MSEAHGFNYYVKHALSREGVFERDHLLKALSERDLTGFQRAQPTI